MLLVVCSGMCSAAGMQGGRHNGRLLSEVVVADPSYCRWLIGEAEAPRPFKTRSQQLDPVQQPCDSFFAIKLLLDIAKVLWLTKLFCYTYIYIHIYVTYIFSSSRDVRHRRGRSISSPCQPSQLAPTCVLCMGGRPHLKMSAESSGLALEACSTPQGPQSSWEF